MVTDDSLGLSMRGMIRVKLVSTSNRQFYVLCMIAQLFDIVKPMTAPKFQMKSILWGSHQDVRSTGPSECVQMSD